MNKKAADQTAQADLGPFLFQCNKIRLSHLKQNNDSLIFNENICCGAYYKHLNKTFPT